MFVGADIYINIFKSGCGVDSFDLISEVEVILVIVFGVACLALRLYGLHPLGVLPCICSLGHEVRHDEDHGPVAGRLVLAPAALTFAELRLGELCHLRVIL